VNIFKHLDKTDVILQGYCCYFRVLESRHWYSVVPCSMQSGTPSSRHELMLCCRWTSSSTVQPQSERFCLPAPRLDCCIFRGRLIDRRICCL